MTLTLGARFCTPGHRGVSACVRYVCVDPIGPPSDLQTAHIALGQDVADKEGTPQAGHLGGGVGSQQLTHGYDGDAKMREPCSASYIGTHTHTVDTPGVTVRRGKAHTGGQMRDGHAGLCHPLGEVARRANVVGLRDVNRRTKEKGRED
jgi:hypothetical protein